MSRTLAAGWLAFATMGGAQLALPLTERRAGATVVVVVAMGLATAAFTAERWGVVRAAAAVVAVVAGAFVLEWVGSRTGWPFGRYDYTAVLQPQVAGVPVVVPLAWFAMAVPARQVATEIVRSPAARVAVGALALTAWDLFLDPQMVDEGFWAWEGDGAWRGIPLSNYAGWLAASAVVMVVLDRVLPAGRARPSTAARRSLLAVYTWMALVETVGFLVVYGDVVVAAVGGLAMGGLAVLAWRAVLATDDGRLDDRVAAGG